MSNSLTIVIPNRNRDLKTVRRSVNSIIPQLNESTHLVVVDYGSELSYQVELEQLLKTFDQVELIKCPTQGQLWNKSRCINIVLQSCKTTHLMVSDMDMLWHPEFVKKEVEPLSLNESVYFTVGVITQEESKQDKTFEDYKVKFQTNNEATGISIFPTAHLKFINGFDEYYHGWGSEDTDVHVRLKNAGYKVRFHKSDIFFKHQWHPKAYRSIKSKYPYHTLQERTNASYLNRTIKLNRIRSNRKFEMGKIPAELNKSDLKVITVLSLENELKALLYQFSELSGNYLLRIDCNSTFSFKKIIKKLIRNNLPKTLPLENVNNLVLEWIINNSRNSSYSYKIEDQIILLKINLK
ncbi:hypothetical protein DCS32_01470 [Dokdonia sp. Dokd-P16]|uniref:glycosyltransferase family 2 protein n=1 Tax=Dokdonia sp. Dokd-P16 TaxID=2173169 RepID=UPI000D5485B8|nr:galactosyltransferase-related protein [Dokdonia sp. Dokd-P16]AWH72874.1 hypothetical protein DCS32_01470 [Dokdonia sp. Dokd-P16]